MVYYRHMKKIASKSLYIFVLAVAVVCLCLPMVFSAKQAEAQSLEIVIEGGQTSFEFSDFSNAQTKKISIENFAFEVGDIVVYYYSNTSSGSFSYKNLYDYNDDHSGANQIEITSDNISQGAEISINLLKMDGAHFASTGTGDYVIKASIIRGGSVYNVSNLFLSISDKVEGGSAYRLTISCKKTDDESSEFGSYYCTAILTLHNTVVSLEGLNLRWYFVHSGANKAFTNAEQFVWFPDAKGSYMMLAKVEIDGHVYESNKASFDVSVDHTLEIVLDAVGVAVVMTIGVVIGVVVSIKRERVW